jgi:hypothetical protein
MRPVIDMTVVILTLFECFKKPGGGALLLKTVKTLGYLQKLKQDRDGRKDARC